jgi:hypothetical protein
MSIAYEIPEKLPIEALLAPLLRVEEALARLDERARTAPFREGWAERLLYGEACACELARGSLVHLEDLVLLDAGAPARMVTPDDSAALHTLKLSRRALRGDANELLQAPRPGEEATALPAVAEGPEYFFDADRQEEARIEAWRRVLRESRRYPAVIASFLVWDAWLHLDPEQRGGWRAPLLAALVLKGRGKTRHFLLPLDTGQRHSPAMLLPRQSLGARMAVFLDWASTAAEQAAKELDKLAMAERLLQAPLRGRRKNSRLPQLVALLLARPVISVPMAAKALKVSNQAVDAMMKALGSVPRELSGRGRYRVWGII